MISSAEPPSLRDRKRHRTHDDLARAAFELAQERGLDGFTVDEVAERAEVSRRTFFNHFQSKDEAVSEVARVQVASALHRGRAQLVAEGGTLPAAIAGDLLEDEGSPVLAATMLPLLAPSPLEDEDEATYKLTFAVRALLGEDTVQVFRELTRLAEVHSTLGPHLAAIQVSIVDQAAELLRAGEHSGDAPILPAVYAHALPGAVAATMWAVYSGQLEVVELGSTSASAVSVTDLVAQLRSLIPSSLMAPARVPSTPVPPPTISP